MIKVNNSSFSKIKLDSDDVFYVNIDDTCVWGAPVKLYFCPPSTYTSAALATWKNIFAAAQNSLIERLDKKEPTATLGYVSLKEGKLNNRVCFYCNAYYGDTLKVHTKPLTLGGNLRTKYTLSIMNATYNIFERSAFKDPTDPYKFVVNNVSYTELQLSLSANGIQFEKTSSSKGTFVSASAELHSSSSPIVAQMWLTSGSGKTVKSEVATWDMNNMNNKTLRASILFPSNEIVSATCYIYWGAGYNAADIDTTAPAFEATYSGNIM